MCYSTNNNKNLDDEWRNIKCAITETANQIIGKKQYKRNEKWFDQEYMEAIKDKNEARRKMLQRYTRRTQGIYKEMRKIAKRICKDKKREVINRKLRHINELHTRHAVREMYTMTRYEGDINLHNV